MESNPEKTLKRKVDEISSDSEGVAMGEDTQTSKAADNSNLGLCDDILLGEVITQFPWYNRPFVIECSEWWLRAMTHSFPYYARLQHPRCLSNSLVLFHTPNTEFTSYNTLSVWVYSDNEGGLFNLPLPAIPEELRNDVKFMRDDNDERIYSFTRDDVNGQKMFHVSVCDLREGSIRWKKLPPLPILDEQSVLLSCASFDNGGYYTTYHIVWVPNGVDDSPVQDFTVWTLSGRNDLTEWQKQWEPKLGSNPDLINKLIGFNPPIYVEFNIESDSGCRPLKCLYRRCDYSEYCTGYSDSMELPDYFLIQFHGGENHIDRTVTRITSSTLYYIKVSEEDCELSFYKAELFEDSRTTIDGFWEFWDRWFYLGDRPECTAKSFVSKRFPKWEKKTLGMQPCVDIEAIKLAPKGSLHVYSFAAVSMVS